MPFVPTTSGGDRMRARRFAAAALAAVLWVAPSGARAAEATPEPVRALAL